MSYSLTTDYTEIENITSMRVMVSSALLFTYIVTFISSQIHYSFVGIAHLFKDKVKIERMYDHGRRLVLYGIAGTDYVIERC